MSNGNDYYHCLSVPLGQIGVTSNDYHTTNLGADLELVQLRISTVNNNLKVKQVGISTEKDNYHANPYT